MRPHAKTLSPCRLATCSLIIVTKLRCHHTTITGSQLGKTGVAMALMKGLIDLPGTVRTANLT